MNLLLDIGNSRVKWALADRDGLRAGRSFVHHGRPLFREFDAEWGKLPRPRQVAVCCVAANRVTERLEAWLAARWDRAPHYVRSVRRACGVTSAYPNPAQLGTDRWAALVGAYAAGLAPACIVDSGTALTVDLLDARGCHHGGWIVPGLGLGRAVLGRRAGRIEPVEVGRPCAAPERPADCTEDAVLRGVLYQLVAFVDRVMADLRQRPGEAYRPLLTGGDAETLQPLLADLFELRPDLVLEGVAVLARRTRRVVAGQPRR